jgi:hypothetical protein
MADNTQLSVQSGGDTIRTDELISETTGLATAKAQVVKLMTGQDGVDGGVVTRANPLPVTDLDVKHRLDTIIGQLDRILAALEADTL